MTVDASVELPFDALPFDALLFDALLFDALPLVELDLAELAEPVPAPSVVPLGAALSLLRAAAAAATAAAPAAATPAVTARLADAGVGLPDVEAAGVGAVRVEVVWVFADWSTVPLEALLAEPEVAALEFFLEPLPEFFPALFSARFPALFPELCSGLFPECLLTLFSEPCPALSPERCPEFTAAPGAAGGVARATRRIEPSPGEVRSAPDRTVLDVP